MKKQTVNKLQKYVIFFYVYAFIGWIIDVLICFVTDGVLENRGFLYETLCPIYGFAALVLIMLSKKFKRKDSFIKKVFVATLWCSVLEFVTSLVLELCFGIRWWDYSNEPYNIQGRVCLAASILWGFLAIIFMKDIHPYIAKKVRKRYSKIKLKTRNVIIYSMLTFTTLDFILSIIKYVNIR